MDEFCIEDINIFNKYFKIVRQLELQSQKQVLIIKFF